MSKLLVMTDTHLVPAPGRIIGLDPRDRLIRGLAHAAKHHKNADRLILMGDLTHAGDAKAYLDLRQMLDALPWPVTLMMGNHDHRARFREAFPEHPVDENGFVQSAFDLEDVRIITLDSLDDAPTIPEAGRLCSERMDWLEAKLKEADRPCLIFIHHPPFQTGLTAMDGIALRDAKTFRDLLKSGPVAHVFAGHIHRNISANVDGIAMTVLKSTCQQTPLRLDVPEFGTPFDAPGGMGVVLTKGQDIVVHFEDF